MQSIVANIRICNLPNSIRFRQGKGNLVKTLISNTVDIIITATKYVLDIELNFKAEN